MVSRGNGRELVSRRVTALREYAWSSWRMYAGLEPGAQWLCQDRLQGPEQEAAADRLFQATPDQLGSTAVWAAQKDRESQA